MIYPFRTKEDRATVRGVLYRQAETGVSLNDYVSTENDNYRQRCFLQAVDGVRVGFTRDAMVERGIPLKTWHLSISFRDPRTLEPREPHRSELRDWVVTVFSSALPMVWYVPGSPTADGNVIRHYSVSADEEWKQIQTPNQVARLIEAWGGRQIFAGGQVRL